MADRLVIELDAEGELLRRLDEAVRRIGNAEELFANIGGLLEQNINQRFDHKVDPTGTPWAPLAPSTARRYFNADRGNTAGTLLERTRQMRDSIAENTVVGADFVEVGMGRLTDDGAWDVPVLHEFGTTRMPRRGLLTADPEAGELGAQDRDDVLEEIERYLLDVLG